jgi:hypothetical protein
MARCLATLLLSVGVLGQFEGLDFDPNAPVAQPKLRGANAVAPIQGEKLPELSDLIGMVDGMKFGAEAATPAPAAALPSDIHKALAQLEDDDPKAFGAYDASGIIGAGTCMGGFIKEFNLYLDCKKLLGFLAVMNTNLNDMSNLKNLQSIINSPQLKAEGGNGLIIKNNPSLITLKGLEQLKLVPGGLTIEGNPVLKDVGALALNGLGQNAAGQAVVVKKNPVLQNLPDLSKLIEAQIKGAVTIEENQILNQIQGLSGVKEINGDLVLKANNLLMNLDGLDRVTVIRGNLVLNNNPSLKDIMGLQGVTEVLGSIVSSNLPSLKSLEGLHQVSKVGKDLNGNSVTVVHNAIETLSGLRGLFGLIEGAVSITNNKHLSDVNGLKNVRSIGSNLKKTALTISQNDKLKNLDGLEGLNGKLDGAVVIVQNPSLEKLAGLQHISEIGANTDGVALEVSFNDALENLIGLKGLQKAGGAIEVTYNANLKSLAGLENVKEISGKEVKSGASLEIIGNGLLDVTKADLKHLTKLAGGAKVSGNNCVEQKIDDSLAKLLAAQGAGGVDLPFIHQQPVVGCVGAVAAKPVEVKQVVSVGETAGDICGGISGSESWKVFGTTGLQAVVDSSKCNYKVAPNYMTSVVGDSAHWQLSGVNSIYDSKPNSFNVKVWHPVLRGKFMQYFAQRYSWRMSWLADSGKSSGITGTGATGWRSVKGTKNVLVADVKTTASDYLTTPRYVVSLHGEKNHWMVQGAHSIYHPKKDSFRVFAVYPTPITPKQAEEWKWRVAWVGSNDDVTSGRSGNDWVSYTSKGTNATAALYTDIDTSKGKYPRTPAYVTSVTGESHHWSVTGASSIYKATNQHFRVYLDHAKSQEFAKLNDWRVNYIAYADPVPCTQTNWGSWSACSKSCGKGLRTRSRSIITRSYFGGACAINLDSEACDSVSCPVDCVMEQWSAWSICSKTCGRGVTGRTRKIKVAPIKGRECGRSSEARYCDAGPCPIHCTVSAWSAYSKCSKSCGTGSMKRTRTITKMPENGGFVCPRLDDVEECNVQSCPVDCAVSEWGKWSECTVTCSSGTQTRSRTIKTENANGGRICPATEMSQICNAGPCPVHCQVSSWGLWSDCTKTCGSGKKTRSRTVFKHAQHGGYVCPSLSQNAWCNTQACPVDCQLGKWSTWGQCTKSCGVGTHKRTREVVVPTKYGGLLCSFSKETKACNSEACPIDCAVSTWSIWSKCSKSCGPNGVHFRTRDVLSQPVGGKACPGLKETKPCDGGACPVHCKVSEWSAWNDCSVTCGGGKQTRTRKVVQHAQNQGYVCPLLKDTQTCNTEVCAVDCVMSAWDAWGPCTHTCGFGLKYQFRKVLRKPQFGGKACGSDWATMTCGSFNCPVDCKQTAFYDWSTCTKTCGSSGTQFRIRKTWRKPANGGLACGPEKETRTCFLGPCPVHCRVSGWSEWTKCDKSCGSGKSIRERKLLVRGSHGGSVCPALKEEKSCNLSNCPVDCKMSPWTEWQTCSKSCGGGVQSKYRRILLSANYGGKACAHIKMERVCGMEACPIDCATGPWSEFGACSKTCGDGVQTQTRKISIPAKNGGKACGPLTQSLPCKDDPCPIHCQVSEWGSYGACSKTCGGGTKVKARAIIRKGRHGGAVCPLLEEATACNTFRCPKDCLVSKWSHWSDFNDGGASLKRTRFVTREASLGGKRCPALVQTKAWSEKCENHAVFGKWSGCSKPCGGGHKYRFWEKIECSKTSTVKYHVRFRQGMRCNTQLCAMGEDTVPAVVQVPKLVGLHQKIVGGYDLHNNLELEEQGSWLALSANEIAEHSLPAEGTWQKLQM